MPRTIRNEFDKKVNYESLMKAHKLSRRGKGYRKETILFNLKQEEYIMWLYERLKTGTYKHLERIWEEYYILKMDVRKYFQNIDYEFNFCKRERIKNEYSNNVWKNRVEYRV